MARPERKIGITTTHRLTRERPTPPWAVFSIDEKTGMQAKSRINPTRPAGSDQPARQEFEYKRHGTKALFAAFQSATGEVIVQPTNSTRSVNFVSFLAELDSQVPRPSRTALHRRQSGYTRHPRSRSIPRHPPPDLPASHPDPRLMAQPDRKCGSRSSPANSSTQPSSQTPATLPAPSLDYVTDYNTRAKPFNWTYNATTPSPDSNLTSARDH